MLPTTKRKSKHAQALRAYNTKRTVRTMIAAWQQFQAGPSQSTARTTQGLSRHQVKRSYARQAFKARVLAAKRKRRHASGVGSTLKSQHQVIQT